MKKYYVYCLYKSGEVVYTGSTTKLSQRITSHKVDKDFDLVGYCELPNQKIMLQLEKYAIYKLKPKYNKLITVCTEKPDVDFDWVYMEATRPTQGELNDIFIHDMNEYMKLQAGVIGVDFKWVYGVTFNCPSIFKSFGIITNQKGEKVIVGYTDNSGKSLDDLCHSLGLITFEEFRQRLKKHKIRELMAKV